MYKIIERNGANAVAFFPADKELVVGTVDREAFRRSKFGYCLEFPDSLDACARRMKTDWGLDEPTETIVERLRTATAAIAA